MKILMKAKLKVLLGIAAFCLILLTSEKILANSINLTVDVDRILSDVSNNPIGLGINFSQNPVKITAPLQDLKVGSLRFPDGVLADNYLFDKNSPKNPKASIQDTNIWQMKSLATTNGTWHSDLNFDDFISLCRSVGAEPFIVIGIDAIAYTGNAPHATPEEVLEAAVEWVRYANVVQGYDVKYWEIGNENDIERHSSIEVKWTPELYAETVVEFSHAMKQVDPGIQIGANGMQGMYPDWWAKIMPLIQQDVDFLVTHQYSWIENYKQWRDYVYEYDYNITDAIKVIDLYNPNLRLNITETSSFNPGKVHTNNTWKMLHNFEMLGQALRFNQIDYIHFWTSRWLETDSYSQDTSSFDTDYRITPMGYSVKVWNKFLKNKMVYITEKADVVRSWATYNPEDESLNILLLNKRRKTKNVNIKSTNYEGLPENNVWILKGSSPQSVDVSWQRLSNVLVNKANLKIKLEPLSITVISFQKEQNIDRITS